MKLNKVVFSYLVFGILTTLINIVSYAILSKFFGMDYKFATIIAWMISVFFAFITNKLYVFNSKETNVSLMIKEFLSFIFFRLLSLILDIGIMLMMVEWLRMDDLLAKIAANVFVVIFNFFASKYVIFTKRKV